MRKPKIAVAFYGLPRASSVTLPSIQANILEPAGQLGEVEVRYHFLKQAHIDNPSTGENSILPEDNYRLFESFAGELDTPEGIPERYGFERLKEFGDAWDNGFKSLRNLLLQLHSLKCVTSQVLEFAPDIVVFARPDLLYHDSFDVNLENALKGKSQQVSIPYWQWCGGYNDRFSIVGKEAIETVGYRIDMIDKYLMKLQRPLHAERLLQFAIDEAGMQVYPMSLRASRVRVGAHVHQEKFKKPALLRRIKWQFREACKR